MMRSALTEVGRHNPMCWGPQWNKKGKERVNSYSLSSWAGLSRFSCPHTAELLVLRPSNSRILHQQPSDSQAFRLRLNYTTSFPGSPATDPRLWDFSASITSWANFYNKSPLICIYTMYPTASVSLENPDYTASVDYLFPWELLKFFWFFSCWVTLDFIREFCTWR